MKGKTNNPNGRPKGVPNKMTKELKEWIRQLIDGNREQLESDLKALDPKERWQVIEKLMSYVVPKMQSVDVSERFESKTVSEFENWTDEELEEYVYGKSE